MERGTCLSVPVLGCNYRFVSNFYTLYVYTYFFKTNFYTLYVYTYFFQNKLLYAPTPLFVLDGVKS
jgi:hypothetical protein